MRYLYLKPTVALIRPYLGFHLAYFHRTPPKRLSVDGQITGMAAPRLVRSLRPHWFGDFLVPLHLKDG